MFRFSKVFNADISAWDIGGAVDTSGMFSGALAFNIDLSSWNTTNVGQSYGMFENANASSCSLTPGERIYCNPGKLKDGEVCTAEQTCDTGVCRGGRCCDRAAAEHRHGGGECVACTASGACFHPLTTSNRWINATMPSIERGDLFPAEMVGNALEFKTIKWNPSAGLGDDGATDIEVLVSHAGEPKRSSQLTYELVWLPATTTTSAGYKTAFQVGKTLPVHAQYGASADNDPGGIDIDIVHGSIYASPAINQDRTYTAWLVAVDRAVPAQKAGLSPNYDRVLLKEWTLQVKESLAEFVVDAFVRQADGDSGNAAQPGELPTADGSYKRASILGAPTLVQCEYGEPCPVDRLTRLDLADGSTIEIGESGSTQLQGSRKVTFSVEPTDECEHRHVHAGDHDAAAYGAVSTAVVGALPPQFLINQQTGFISSTIKRPKDGQGDPIRDINTVCRVQISAIHKEGLKLTESVMEVIQITIVKSQQEIDAEASAQQRRTIRYLIYSVSAAIAFVLLGVAAYKYRQYQIKMRPVDFESQLATMLASGAIAPEQLRSDRKPREIWRRDLRMIKMVGHGQFGEVWKCVLDEMFRRGTPEYTVAAKTVLDADQSPEATNELLSEASVLAQVAGHRNLVSIIGVITRGDPLVLVLQYCEHGSLLDELKTRAAEGTPVTFASKMQMALDIASGMEHLSSLHFIHRDLAARNVLVADGTSSAGVPRVASDAVFAPKHPTRQHSYSEYSSLVCKIADFGLSRSSKISSRGGDAGGDDDLDGEISGRGSCYQSSKGVFAIRWTSPEAMEQQRYTYASDVWSFAIVLVEVMQDGNSPYHGKSNPDVMTLVMAGGRHPKPTGGECTDELYKFMLLCWHQDIARRPSFTKIVDHFKLVAEEASKPAVPERQRSHFKPNSAKNLYNDFGFGKETTFEFDGSVVEGVIDFPNGI